MITARFNLIYKQEATGCEGLKKILGSQVSFGSYDENTHFFKKGEQFYDLDDDAKAFRVNMYSMKS